MSAARRSMPQVPRRGARSASAVGPGPSPARVGEVRAFIARERDAVDRWEVVGARRLGYDVHGAVVADLPARTTHAAFPHVVMWRRGQLSDLQFAVAEALRRDLEAAGSWPEGAIDWAKVEEALAFRRPGGAPRLRWPPKRPSSRVRRGPSGFGPPGGGCLDARRRIDAALRTVGPYAAHLLLWVIGEARTCAEWTSVRNASRRADDSPLAKQYAPGLLRDSLALLAPFVVRIKQKT